MAFQMLKKHAVIQELLKGLPMKLVISVHETLGGVFTEDL
jgi:hypothetical protein